LWEKGRIDHDDVIHLAHRVLFENEPVMGAILARFPYLLLDEFQYTGRLQCEIVEAFAEAGATVGVIGDRNQAIFEFSDAEPKLFDDFEPNGCLRCEIEGNRRSTQQIVDVLNKLRQDGLQQISIAEVKDGPRPTVVVGELRDAVTFAKDQCGPEGLGMVARGHAGVARLLLLDDTPSTPEIWKDCGDEDREFFLRGFCRAIRHFEIGEGRQALTQLPGLFRGRTPRAPLKGDAIEGDKRRRAFKVDTLAWVVSFHKREPNATVFEFYEALAEYLKLSSWDVGLTGLRKGKFSTWAKKTRFGSLVAAVGLEATRAKARTIHGFKGDETRSLLLLLDDMRLRKKLTNPGDSEDDRLIYVALSRAKKQLFVAVPDLPKPEEDSFRDMGFDVKRI
jgi:DNA helicase-2/ATP-dependent DNA helicase PcrA